MQDLKLNSNNKNSCNKNKKNYRLNYNIKKCKIRYYKRNSVE